MIEVKLRLELWSVPSEIEKNAKHAFLKRWFTLPITPFHGLKTIHGIIREVSVDEDGVVNATVSPVYVTWSPSMKTFEETVQVFVIDGWWLEV